MVKYFLSRPEIKTGNRITSQMIEKYREATKKAMQKVFGVTINEFSTIPKKTIIILWNIIQHNYLKTIKIMTYQIRIKKTT